MTNEEKIIRLLEIKRRILSSGGEDDTELLEELGDLSNHPDPLDILLNMDDYTPKEFKNLMFNYEAIVLPGNSLSD